MAVLRRSDLAGFAALGAILTTLAALVLGRPAWAIAGTLLALALGLLTRYWSTRYREPMPYALRFALRVPRGNHSPERLREVLAPRRGERMLEVGPGIGIHALPMAAALGPAGSLEIVDIQIEMLDDVMRRAGRAGIANLSPRLGSAAALPFADGTFDGAYLIGVLGEIPDGPLALRELRRVLKPDGRLVIGEVFFDSDFVRLGALTRLASAAGLRFERKLGSGLTYLARFRPA